MIKRPGTALTADHRMQPPRKERADEGETYSERFNGSELLHDGLLLGEVSSTDSESGGCDDWKTDGNTDNQQDKSVMKQVDRAVLGSSDFQVTEETSHPGSENPANDQDQERRADGVHDGLEMSLILGPRNERGSATDERSLSRVCDDGICLSTLATSSVVDDIGDVLVDSEGLSSHGRLIDGQKSVSRSVLVLELIIILALLSSRLAGLGFQFAEVFLVTVGVVVGRDNSGVTGDDLSILDDDLVDVRIVN